MALYVTFGKSAVTFIKYERFYWNCPGAKRTVDPLTDRLLIWYDKLANYTTTTPPLHRQSGREHLQVNQTLRILAAMTHA